MIENQPNNKLKTLRTNNGIEFCKIEFDKFSKQKGIMRHITVKYTPPKKGSY